MLGDLAVAHAHDVDGLELDFAAGRRHAKELSPVRPVIGFVGRHAVTIGKLPMDVGVKVGKGSAQNLVELASAVLVGGASRLRRVIEKVVGEEFVEHFEIPAALHLFGVPADDCLRGFAHTALAHWVYSKLVAAALLWRISCPKACAFCMDNGDKFAYD